MHYSAVRSRLGARGTMITTSYRGHATVGVRILFFSRHYPAVWSRLSARGTMTTTSYRSCSAMGVRDFFRRGTTLLSGRVLVHAEDDNDKSKELVMNKKQEHSVLLHVESWQRHPTVEERRRVFVPFFRRGTTLLSGRVLVNAER
ncbi:hypothetical protein TNCV_1065041 [Trichonephila clavipes]|nr:hypothetical protein TNCV_1065041 [Trichonephila clavipes]